MFYCHWILLYTIGYYNIHRSALHPKFLLCIVVMTIPQHDRVHPAIFLDCNKTLCRFSANLAAHFLLKVFFAIFGLFLADEKGQDRLFFFEDIRALIMAREIACQTQHVIDVT